MSNQKKNRADSKVIKSASGTIKISNKKGTIEVRNKQGVITCRMLRF
jgi:hypothetical protein